MTFGFLKKEAVEAKRCIAEFHKQSLEALKCISAAMYAALPFQPIENFMEPTKQVLIGHWEEPQYGPIEIIRLYTRHDQS